jgi:hypothetical protein
MHYRSEKLKDLTDMLLGVGIGGMTVNEILAVILKESFSGKAAIEKLL